MPSPELLPRGRSLPTAPPPALDRVLSSARRRRRRQAGAAGAATVAVAVGAVIALAPGTSPATLHTITPGVTSTPTANGRVDTSPSPVPPDVRRARANARSAAERAAAARTRAERAAAQYAAEHPQSHVDVSPSPTGDGGAATAQTGPTVADAIIGPQHRMTAYDPTRPCDGSGPAAATGWCSYYVGATSGTPGRSVQLATAVCRLPGRSTGELVGSDGEQADFAVGVDAYPPSWSWSHGRTFSRQRTSISVPAGSCVEWYVAWSVVDDAGRPLSAGTYYLDAKPLMSSTGSAAAGTYNPITFTVH